MTTEEMLDTLQIIFAQIMATPQRDKYYDVFLMVDEIWYFLRDIGYEYKQQPTAFIQGATGAFNF